MKRLYYGRLLARLKAFIWNKRSSISSNRNWEKEFTNRRLVVILPSFGERYLSTAMFGGTIIQPEKMAL